MNIAFKLGIDCYITGRKFHQWTNEEILSAIKDKNSIFRWTKEQIEYAEKVLA